MITFDNVTKKYCNVTALNSVSFNIHPGEIVGLVGANGAGKTTTIKLLTKNIQPDGGNIFFNGDNINSLISYPSNIIAYVPDDPVFYEFLTVNEHLQFIKSMYPNGLFDMKILIDKLNLNAHLDKMPYSLSKGNKQKLMIATALMRPFDYLIADEPFTGLDPRQIKVMKKILLELRYQGKGVLLSTHLLDVIELFCDRYIMLNNGNILACGSRDEIISTYQLSNTMTIEDIYLQLVDKKEEVEMS